MPVLPVRQVESPPVEQQQQPDSKPIPNAEIHIIKQLPSNFLAYDVKQIEIRSLTLGELKYLASEGVDKRNFVDLYRNVILNYDIDKLTWPDLSYIASHIALFTTESAYWTFAASCLECGAPLTIKLSGEHFVKFRDTSELKGYPLTVTINGHELDFGFINVSKYLDVIDKISGVEEPMRALYALSGMVLNKPLDEAFTILKASTNYDDLELLLRISDLLNHNALPLECQCQHCKHIDKYQVDVEVSTIRPFRDNASSLDTRISFGQRPK